jgi:hypothetical protein
MFGLVTVKIGLTDLYGNALLQNDFGKNFVKDPIAMFDRIKGVSSRSAY